MRRALVLLPAFGLLLVVAVAGHGGQADNDISPYVDGEGNIRVPEDYREWSFLGSWHIAPEKGVDDSAGVAGFHNVYVQPGTARAYRETGGFPDGTVIVKELLASDNGRLTTGEVSWATEVEGWFVMVKDTRGRFPANSLWGNGWGWALFDADDPQHTVTKNWRIDCLGCHTPARNTDWVFVEGYPVLQRSPSETPRSGDAAPAH